MLVSSGLLNLRRVLSLATALLFCSILCNWPFTARANEKITYLFPAPPILPAFGPIQLAKG